MSGLRPGRKMDLSPANVGSLEEKPWWLLSVEVAAVELACWNAAMTPEWEDMAFLGGAGKGLCA